MGLLDDIRLGGNDNATAKAKAVIGKCPHCSTKLNADDGKSVECPCCGSLVHSSELRTGASAKVNAIDPQMQALIADVKSMESVEDAVVFLSNYFENYDWDAYLDSTILYIPEVEEMVKSIKIKSGSKGAVWGLDFDCVAVPLTKRIANLAKAERKMAELYSDIDNTDLMDIFDAYKASVNAIIDEKDNILKRLQNAVGYAEKLGLDKAKLTDMKDQLAAIEKAIKSLKKVADLVDVDALKKARKEADNAKSAKLSEQGINAEEVYNEAVANFNTGRIGYRRALDLFISIRGYADSAKYISKIDKYFIFNREIIFIAGKPFVLKEKVVQNVLDVSSKEGNKEDNANAEGEDGFEGKTYELYPIVDEQPAATAAVTGITEIISWYATDLFYIKKGKELCSFNTETGEEKVMDGADVSNYVTSKKWYNTAGDKIYICKKLGLVKEKLGCLKKLFGKKEGYVARANNYSLEEINLSTGIITNVVPELVDVYQFNSKNLFYTYAENVNGEVATKLRYVDITTGIHNDLLSENCDIHKIVENKVVYSYHTPNALNKELRVYDIAAETDGLIEANVYEFVNVIKGKVFYKVGNAKFSPLFSNSYEGNDRVQIAENIGNILTIRGNWIYVVIGRGKNKLLRKISHDGLKVIDLCASFEKIVKVTDAYIYYVNCWDELCVVRFDGKEEKLIADNIDANNIIVEKDAFYYLRKELVARNRYAYSLYKMDAEGKNVIKLAFDINRMQNYDEEKLYISRDELAYFEITIPEVKGKSHVEKISSVLKKVVEYNKLTGEFKTIRTIGLPSTSEYEFKTGCFGKTEKVESSYKQVPGPLTYFRNTEEAGSVYDEQVAEAEENATNDQASGGFLAGCIAKIKGLFSKK